MLTVSSREAPLDRLLVTDCFFLVDHLSLGTIQTASFNCVKNISSYKIKYYTNLLSSPPPLSKFQVKGRKISKGLGAHYIEVYVIIF